MGVGCADWLGNPAAIRVVFRDRPTKARASEPTTGATVLRRLLLCFSFFGEAVRRHPCSCCRGHGPSTVLAERRQREQPRQVACGGASRIGQAPAEGRGWRHPACGGGQSTIMPFFCHYVLFSWNRSVQVAKYSPLWGDAALRMQCPSILNFHTFNRLQISDLPG